MISLSGGLDVAAHEGGLDGQFAMAAINQHAKLNAAGTAMIEQCIQRRSRGPSGIEHVVNQDDVLVLDVELHGALLHFRAMADGGEIVAIERDVEGADRDCGFFDASQDLRQPLRQRHAAPHDADQSEVGDAIVFFDDLMRQPNQGALDFGCRQDLRFLAEISGLDGGLGHAVRIIRKAQAGEQPLPGALCPSARESVIIGIPAFRPDMEAPSAPPAAVITTNTTPSTSRISTTRVAAPCGLVIQSMKCCTMACAFGVGIVGHLFFHLLLHGAAEIGVGTKHHERHDGQHRIDHEPEHACQRAQLHPHPRSNQDSRHALAIHRNREHARAQHPQTTTDRDERDGRENRGANSGQQRTFPRQVPLNGVSLRRIRRAALRPAWCGSYGIGGGVTPVGALGGGGGAAGIFSSGGTTRICGAPQCGQKAMPSSIEAWQR